VTFTNRAANRACSYVSADDERDRLRVEVDAVGLKRAERFVLLRLRAARRCLLGRRLRADILRHVQVREDADDTGRAFGFGGVDRGDRALSRCCR
jgi:hypothetical protein